MNSYRRNSIGKHEKDQFDFFLILWIKDNKGLFYLGTYV